MTSTALRCTMCRWRFGASGGDWAARERIWDTAVVSRRGGREERKEV